MERKRCSLRTRISSGPDGTAGLRDWPKSGDRRSAYFAPNLLLELSKLTSAVALAELVRAYGQHRFVFGSGGLPHASRQIMSCLQETALDRATITAIVEGNARLLASGAYAERYL